MYLFRNGVGSSSFLHYKHHISHWNWKLNSYIVIPDIDYCPLAASSSHLLAVHLVFRKDNKLWKRTPNKFLPTSLFFTRIFPQIKQSSRYPREKHFQVEKSIRCDSLCNPLCALVQFLYVVALARISLKSFRTLCYLLAVQAFWNCRSFHIPSAQMYL